MSRYYEHRNMDGNEVKASGEEDMSHLSKGFTYLHTEAWTSMESLKYSIITWHSKVE
jgi:hypothetical protein